MAALEDLPQEQFNIKKVMSEFVHNMQNQSIGGISGTNFLVDHHGTAVQYPMSLSLTDFPNFKSYAEDIVIMGVAKAGASRFSALVGSIMHHTDPDYLYKLPDLQEKVPWLEFCTPAGEKGPRGLDQIAMIPSPRAYWTRVNFDGLPASVIETKAKVVYHLRHPKDTVVTLYNHYLGRRAFIKFEDTLSDLIERMVTDKVASGPWFKHYATAWKHRNDPNVFVCSFEEFSENPEKSITDLAKFLSQNLTEEEVSRIAFDCHFDQMSTNQFSNHTQNAQAGEFDVSLTKVMRSGKVGAWKSEISPEDNQKINEWMRKNLEDPELDGIARHFPSTFAIE